MNRIGGRRLAMLLAGVTVLGLCGSLLKLARRPAVVIEGGQAVDSPGALGAEFSKSLAPGSRPEVAPRADPTADGGVHEAEVASAAPPSSRLEEHGSEQANTVEPCAGGPVVHVAGAVGKPGVYRLSAGARVADAVAAAGGGLPAASMDDINLALPVRDGEQIFIPRRQEQAGRGADAPHSASAAPQPTPSVINRADLSKTAPDASAFAAGLLVSASSDSTSRLININTASEAELDALPGIGPAIAGRIVEYRQAVGGFRSVDDLLNVSGIGEIKFDRIAPLVTVR
ncbi:MAG: helix-hairpin-helix domain-containing protein [Clostridia bacterium]|nr:helix-hairpin-helix domain-containing protein [Clostridia bacterium]